MRLYENIIVKCFCCHGSLSFPAMPPLGPCEGMKRAGGTTAGHKASHKALASRTSPMYGSRSPDDKIRSALPKHGTTSLVALYAKCVSRWLRNISAGRAGSACGECGRSAPQSKRSVFLLCGVHSPQGVEWASEVRVEHQDSASKGLQVQEADVSPSGAAAQNRHQSLTIMKVSRPRASLHTMPCHAHPLCPSVHPTPPHSAPLRILNRYIGIAF